MAANPKGDTSEVQSNVIECWSMPWWGFKQGSAAMMVIVETPDDAAYQFSHPAGGPTVIGPRWRAAAWKTRLHANRADVLLANGNYVDLAKRYRRHAIETGCSYHLRKRQLDARSCRLIGTPLMRTGILTNFKEDSARATSTPRTPSENVGLTPSTIAANLSGDSKHAASIG